AILKGLSPKENREIPPLNYPRVYRLKQRFPRLRIVLNGGIRTLEKAVEILEHVDGVMVGREAYQNPWILQQVDPLFFSEEPSFRNRIDVLEAFLPYVEMQLAEGVPLQHMIRHILGLFHGVPGGRAFRRHLSENAFRKDAGISVLEDAMACVDKGRAISLHDSDRRLER